mmetsp:Transcript_52595/g.91813  ORF Transcript_52595/g.91813 Transcript_52595/m.91813 type:complete len:206 (-) Transcript_52595:84-701(-)
MVRSVDLLSGVVVGVRHTVVLGGTAGPSGRGRGRRNRLVHIRDLRSVVVITPAQVLGASGSGVGGHVGVADAVAPGLSHAARGHQGPSVVGGHRDMAVLADIPPVEGTGRSTGHIMRDDGALAVALNCRGAGRREVAGTDHERSAPSSPSATISGRMGSGVIDSASVRVGTSQSRIQTAALLHKSEVSFIDSGNINIYRRYNLQP